MGDNDRIDPAFATDGIPRRRPWRRLLLTGVTLTALILGLGFLFRERLFSLWRAEDPLGNRLPSGALDDYVPQDSEAVLTVNMRQMLQSPVGKKHLAPVMQHLFRQAGGRLRWIDYLGIKPLEDIDSLQIFFVPSAGDQPLWLVRARLNPARIQVGPNKLQETTLDHFRVWQYTDREEKQTTWLAPVGDLLVVCESRGPMRAALRHAEQPRPITLRDAALRELLPRVDRRQSVWLAASLKSRASLAGIEDYLLRMVLRPLLDHADSVHGGLTCAEDIQGELHFRSSTAERAAMLESALRSTCEAAPGAAWLLGSKKEFTPLLHLLGSSKIEREENQVVLRCRLTAEQLER